MVVLEKLKPKIIGEDISSQIDGIIDEFTTLNNFIEDSLKVYVNGQRMAKDVDFEVTAANKFRLLNFVPLTSFIILVDYSKSY